MLHKDHAGCVPTAFPTREMLVVRGGKETPEAFFFLFFRRNFDYILQFGVSGPTQRGGKPRFLEPVRSPEG